MTIVSENSDGAKCVELSDVIKIEEGKIRQHLDEVVRQSVEETLNGLLDAEADELCGAKRYERSPERLDTRAGHYERTLQTRAGEVTLKMPLGDFVDPLAVATRSPGVHFGDVAVQKHSRVGAYLAARNPEVHLVD